MELKEYSTEDLRKELRRRKLAKNSAEWYYIYEDEEETDPEWKAEEPNFILINRRKYHLKHEIQDTNISGFLKLPKEFKEWKPSNFRYEKRKYRKIGEEVHIEAEQKLQSYGFTKINKPLLSDDALVIHYFKMSDRPVMHNIYWHVDTRELKDVLDTFLLHNNWKEFVPFQHYVTLCKDFAESKNCVAYFFNIFESSCEAAFLKKEVFNSLPKNLYGRRDGEE